MNKSTKKRSKSGPVDLKKLFRFKSFSERIASIKIDVVHRVAHSTATAPEDRETFFADALGKWKELNCTVDFVTFSREVQRKADSLAQLVHHKEDIVEQLKSSLQVKDTLAYEPLLDLLVQLARDLQGEFYPLFQDFFHILVTMSNTHNPDVIQSVFTTLAYLFKFQWRHMLKDMHNLYRLFSELLLQSQKPHIRQFAVESFGFLLRKVRDKEQLFSMIFSSLSRDEELAEGVGQLLFEVCKGLPQQLHSCTEQVFPLVLQKLGSISLPCELVFQALKKMVQLMAEHTGSKFANAVWAPLLRYVSELHSSLQQCGVEGGVSSQLTHGLHLLGIMVSWRRGSRIASSPALLEVILPILSEPSLLPDTLAVALHLAASLVLVSPVLPDCPALVEQVTSKVCTRVQHVTLVVAFFQELANKYPDFQNKILPDCLKFCEAALQHSSADDDRTTVVHFLAELCIRFAPKYCRKSSRGNTSSSSFSLDLSSPPPPQNTIATATRSRSRTLPVKCKLTEEIQGLVMSGLELLRAHSADPMEDGFEQELERLWAGLVCLEHIRPPLQFVVELLQQLLQVLQAHLSMEGAEECTIDKLLFVYSQCVCTVVSMVTSEDAIIDVLSYEDLLAILKLHPASLAVLVAVDSYLTGLHRSERAREEGLLSSSRLVEHILPALQASLTSPSSEIRRMTLKILSAFDQLSLSGSSMEEDDEIDLFQVCLKAEATPAALDQYRHKLLWLEKLKCYPQKFSQLPAAYREVPLRYLLAMLYVNFSLIWEPVTEFIRSYAVEENVKLFWSVFGDILKQSSARVENLPSLVSPPDSHTSWHHSIPALFQYQHSLMSSMECGQPDYANFRILLWKCIAGLNPRMSEPRSRILVPLLLQFIQNEYNLSENLKFEDLRKPASDNSVQPSLEHSSCEDLPASVADEEEEAMTQPAKPERSSTAVGQSSDDRGGGRRTKQPLERSTKVASHRRTLQAMLEVFAKFHTPKVFYRQEELHQLYLELLTHKISEVQRLALSCLLTYKQAFLTPYKENFEALLEDTSFSEQLANFSADSDCSVVAEGHRGSLLPVLIRLLYGRMQQKQGGGGGGGGGRGRSSGGGSSKTMVLRFLGACREEEMAEFVKLLLLPFQSLLGDSRAVCVDSSRAIPLKKQQGFVNMFGQMVVVMGVKISPYLDTLLSVLLKLAATCADLLVQRSSIHSYCVTALKNLRQIIISRLCECFEVFTEHNFDAFRGSIFTAVVWPQVLKLPQECVQNPTPLMKLFLTWSCFPQYYTFLNEPMPDSVLRDVSLTSSEDAKCILHYVFSCLLTPAVSKKVLNCVLELANSLLEDAGASSMETDRNSHAQDGVDSRGSGLVEGRSLLQPFVPQLLHYLSSAVKSKGGKLTAEQLEFAVLSKISGYVSDPVLSSKLVELLLSFLLKGAEAYKKFEEKLLLTIGNLVANVDGITGFYRQLSQLFYLVEDRQSRKILCNIFETLGRKAASCEQTSGITVQLNAWNKRRIEEPDYETRLEGFAAGKRILTAPNEVWSVNSVLPILHNALYFLLKSEDMSIRDAAASFVMELIGRIETDDREKLQVLVLSTMVGAVKQGLRSKQQFARHEYISILSQLVRAFTSHQRFADMAVLTHHDPEVDFFENVKHIQLHRRIRALKKLASVCEEGRLHHNSIMTFLLPLANQVLFTPVTKAEHNLVDEAVAVVGAVSARLTWGHYSFLLSHYLRQLYRRLDIQKPLIKAVVVVLESFHFDLSPAFAGEGEGEGEGGEEEEGGEIPTPGEATSEVLATSCSPHDEDNVVEPLDGVIVEAVGDDSAASTLREEALARKIHKSIVKSILPSLQSVLTRTVDLPGHKLSRQSQDEDAEILRVPVAMAMTKLLLALPETSLQTQLPSLLLKVCQVLKNRSRDVRDIGRSTLVKMATSLGPKYLKYIIKEMKESLTRGYQLHVLGYSLHSLLHGVSSTLESGSLDPCLEVVNEILVEDLFGAPAEEREAGENVAKIPESRSPQSYNCYEIVARFLSPALLPELLAPVKQVLELRSSSKISRTVEEVFRRTGLGIQRNEGFTPQALLFFIHGVISDSIPQLSCSKPRVKRKEAVSSLRERPDSYLLPPVPVRGGERPVEQTNLAAHVISEFGLQLFHTSLKRDKFDPSSVEQLQMLDPFVSLLSSSLSSRHVKLLTRSLQCLTWVVRLPLPSLDDHMTDISAHLFELLRRYARSGAAVGSNRELVLSAFKTMTVVLREFKQHEVSPDELKLLLSFVEEDIHDYQRQGTAFPLLKAILGRKLKVVKEIHAVMKRVAQLSVTGDTDHVRLQCRQAVMQFIMDHPLGKKLQKILDFYIVNLNYKEQSGRESVIEILRSFFTRFRESLLNKHATYFFVPLATQLINDESPTCREMVAMVIKTLLKRVDTSNTNDIVAIIESWVKDEKLIHRRLGVQCLGLLAEVEGKSFEKRLKTFLQLLLDCLCLYDPSANEQEDRDASDGEDHGSHAREGHSEEEDSDSDNEGTAGPGKEEAPSSVESKRTDQTALDHLLFATIVSLQKISAECSVLRAATYSTCINSVWEKLQRFLLHPHTWVRLSSSQLFGLLFASYSPEELVDPPSSQRPPERGGRKRRRTLQATEYLLQDTVSKIQELSHSFCVQLSSPLLTSGLAGQAVKNLVFLAKVLHRLDHAGRLLTLAAEEEDGSSFERDGGRGQGSEFVKRDLEWLITRLSRLAKFEAAHHPKESKKRTSVLHWTAAVSVDLGPEHLPFHLTSLLRAVYRELVATEPTAAGEGLQSLAQEVVEEMKKTCGREVFSGAYAEVHQLVLRNREERRKKAALEAVANPEKSIRRKHKKNELKKVAKKRKISSYRPRAT